MTSPHSPDKLAIEVVQEVAARKAVDPIDLPPIYSVIDPEALDALSHPTNTRIATSDITTTFSYAGYLIIIQQNTHGREFTVTEVEKTNPTQNREDLSVPFDGRGQEETTLANED